jgi:hypothetical protein
VYKKIKPAGRQFAVVSCKGQWEGWKTFGELAQMFGLTSSAVRQRINAGKPLKVASPAIEVKASEDILMRSCERYECRKIRTGTLVNLHVRCKQGNWDGWKTVKELTHMTGWCKETVRARVLRGDDLFEGSDNASTKEITRLLRILPAPDKETWQEIERSRRIASLSALYGRDKFPARASVPSDQKMAA